MTDRALGHAEVLRCPLQRCMAVHGLEVLQPPQHCGSFFSRAIPSYLSISPGGDPSRAQSPLGTRPGYMTPLPEP